MLENERKDTCPNTCDEALVTAAAEQRGKRGRCTGPSLDNFWEERPVCLGHDRFLRTEMGWGQGERIRGSDNWTEVRGCSGHGEQPLGAKTRDGVRWNILKLKPGTFSSYRVMEYWSLDFICGWGAVSIVITRGVIWWKLQPGRQSKGTCEREAEAENGENNLGTIIRDKTREYKTLS